MSLSDSKIRLCVFCGSSLGARAEYAETARALAQELVRRDIELVYGGGDVGLMGVMANSMMQAGGRVIGVMPQFLAERELASNTITQLRIVSTMHERKAMMYDLSDGFIALPGGLGTFEELFEALTWQQLGVQHKPCALINTADYYAPLLRFIAHAAAERFIRAEHRDMLIIAATPTAALHGLLHYQRRHADKWTKRQPG